LNTQMNGTTKRTPNSIWNEGHKLRGERDRDVIRRDEQRIINAVKNNGTTEYKIGDFVRVKMGTLYSSVRKLLKSGDRKNVVANYSPTVYKITNTLAKDKPDRRVGNTTIEYEKSRYTLSLGGTILQTQLKNNNPNAVRKSKRFFASDMQLVNNSEKETYLKDFSIEDALKLNKMDSRSKSKTKTTTHSESRSPSPSPTKQSPSSPTTHSPSSPSSRRLRRKRGRKSFGGFGRRLFIEKLYLMIRIIRNI
jgi:hypothetical protein